MTLARNPKLPNRTPSHPHAALQSSRQCKLQANARQAGELALQAPRHEAARVDIAGNVHGAAAVKGIHDLHKSTQQCLLFAMHFIKDAQCLGQQVDSC